MKRCLPPIVTLLLMAQLSLMASHTFEEQQSLVMRALQHVLYRSSLDDMRNPAPMGEVRDLSTWDGFMGGGDSDWTTSEKKAAFLGFLSSAVTNNQTTAFFLGTNMVQAAVAQCERLAFTNAVPVLKDLALNTDGAWRSEAISAAINLGGLNDEMTTFVDAIITNTVTFTFRERGAACARFANVILLASSSTNAANESICRRATRMLYENREIDTAGAAMLDKLFCARYAGYAQSSNRLGLACFILSHPNCRPYNKRDFTAITNQLLSTGQPLQQLTIDGEGE